MIHMDKNEVIFRAFQKACKHLREHPPYDAGYGNDLETLSCIVDAKSDPEGARWMLYFINKALDEMEDKK